MKKLISLTLLLLSSSFLWANASNLKVGDKFEYRIEDYYYTRKLMPEEMVAVFRKSLPSFSNEDKYEKYFETTLKFQLTRIEADTVFVFKVIPSYFNFYSRYWDARKNNWINSNYYYSTIDENNERLVLDFPLFTSLSFTIKVSKGQLTQINGKSVPNTRSDESQLTAEEEKRYQTRLYSDFSEIQYLQAIFASGKGTKQSFKFDDLQYRLNPNNINAIIEFRNNTSPNHFTVDNAFSFDRKNTLPQLFTQKINFTSPEKQTYLRHTTILACSPQEKTFATKFIKDTTFNKQVDTLIAYPNTSVNGKFMNAKESVLEIRIEYPNYRNKNEILFQIPVDKNGHFTFKIKLEEPVQFHINKACSGYLMPGDRVDILIDEKTHSVQFEGIGAENCRFLNQFDSLFNNYKERMNRLKYLHPDYNIALSQITEQPIEDVLKKNKTRVSTLLWMKALNDYITKQLCYLYKGINRSQVSIQDFFHLDNDFLVTSDLFKPVNLDAFDVWTDGLQFELMERYGTWYSNYYLFTYDLIGVKNSGLSECVLKYLWVKKVWTTDADHNNAIVLYEKFLNEYGQSKYAKELKKFVNQYKSVGKGTPAFDINLIGPDGLKTKLSAYKGKVVYLIFWKEKSEMGTFIVNGPLQNVEAKYDSTKVKFILVNLDKNPKEIYWISNKYKIDCNYIINDSLSNLSVISNKYKIEFFPRIVIIDRFGYIHNPYGSLPTNQTATEKEIQDTLQAESPLFNTINGIVNFSIPFVIIGLIVLLVLNTYRTRRIKFNKRINEIRLMAIRSQMNPHFVFNALNSIQGLVNTNKKAEANLYLSKFATLLRNTLENSESPFITLEEELEAVKTYCELEKMRVDFDYEFNVDSSIKTNEIEISGMLIQPLIENAIVHGLAPKPDNRKLKLSIKQSKNYLSIVVADNGVGIQPEHTDRLKEKGFGLKLIEERIHLLEQEKKKAHIKVLPYGIDKEQGTTVKLVFPIFS